MELRELLGRRVEETYEFVWEDWEEELLREYLPKHYSKQKVATLLKTRKRSGSNGLRRELGEIDMEYALRAYFPHYSYAPFAAFHREQITKLEGMLKTSGSHEADAAPRGHAKSTVNTFGFPMYCIMYERKHYIIIAMDTKDQASEELEKLKSELEENPRIREDFGEMEGPLWNVGSFTTANRVHVKALGTDTKIRGRKFKQFRPDLIIVDDMENDRNVKSEEQRRYLYEEWFSKGLLEAGDEKTDILVLGTIMHEESVLVKILNNPRFRSRIYKAVIQFAERDDLWDEWKQIYTDLTLGDERKERARAFYEANREEMERGAVILWPEKKSYYKMMETLVSNPKGFWSELQNEPRGSDAQLFEPVEIEPDEIPPLDQLEIYGMCDPSKGKNKTSDYSAILTGGRAKDGYIYIIEADIKRRPPSRIVSDIINKHLVFPYRKFGGEANGFQEVLLDDLKEKGREQGVYVNLVKVVNTTNKEARIEAMEPMINNGYVKISKRCSLLLQQLRNYPRGKRDGPDCLEMLISMMKKSSGKVSGGTAGQTARGVTQHLQRGVQSVKDKIGRLGRRLY